jgi:hypothetical protein
MFICSNCMKGCICRTPVAAFVNSTVYRVSVRPLTQARSTAWLAGNMTPCYFAHSAILNEKTSFNISVAKPKNAESTVNIQGINFSQIHQLVTQNILMATCFDSVESSSGLPKNRSNVSKFIVHYGTKTRLGSQNFSQTQQFITQNILMATCFDPIESSWDLPKIRSNVSKFLVHSGISNAFGIPEFQWNTTIYYTKYSYGNMFRLYWVIIKPSKEQIQYIRCAIASSSLRHRVSLSM